MKSSDVIAFSDARARLTDLADEVVQSGRAKVITKNGSSFVALIDARALDRYQALEAEHANLLLLDECESGLRAWLGGERAPAGALDKALNAPLRPPAKKRGSAR